MKWRNRIEGFFEYVLALMFIQGGVRTILFADPLILPGIFTYLVGSAAIYVYGAVFLLVGLLMVFAKVRHHKTLHKHVLMLMYLTCVYVLILALSVNGVQPRLLLTISVGITSAYLWTRWKIRTEYIDPCQFRDSVDELRDDLPPDLD